MTSAYVVIKWPACYNNCPVDRGARNFDDRISEVPLYLCFNLRSHSPEMASILKPEQLTYIDTQARGRIPIPVA